MISNLKGDAFPLDRTIFALVGSIARRCAIKAIGLTMRPCGPACASWRRSPPVRLSPSARSDAPRGPRHESQEVLTSLPRGTGAGAPARRAQAGAWHESTAGNPGGAEPPLDPRLPVGCLLSWEYCSGRTDVEHRTSHSRSDPDSCRVLLYRESHPDAVPIAS